MTAIPLTVIGGFLGAGKTTLVNHLLRHADRRYGVLVNDFGSVNIDAALIAGQDGDMVALSNGCVCCDLGADFGAGLNRLAAQGLDHIVVEASGVSDPWRIAQLALIEPGFDLQPLVVLADASTLADQLDDRYIGDTVARQLRFAELLLLTKTDLLDDPEPVLARVRALRPEARVALAVNGDFPMALLSFPSTLQRASRFAAELPEQQFRRWSWTDSAPLDRDRLRALLHALPASVLRVKGFCLIGPERAPHLLQYAAERWAFTPLEAAQPTALAVIGSMAMPSDDALAAMFAAARLTP